MICLVDGKNRQMLALICAAELVSIQFKSIADLSSAVRRHRLRGAVAMTRR